MDDFSLDLQTEEKPKGKLKFKKSDPNAAPVHATDPLLKEMQPEPQSIPQNNEPQFAPQSGVHSLLHRRGTQFTPQGGGTQFTPRNTGAQFAPQGGGTQFTASGQRYAVYAAG